MSTKKKEWCSSAKMGHELSDNRGATMRLIYNQNLCLFQKKEFIGCSYNSISDSFKSKTP